MKKVLFLIILLVIVIASNSYNYPFVNNSAYNYKTLEVMYDSKKRPHKIVIYKAINDGHNRISITAIDLDVNTYINK